MPRPSMVSPLSIALLLCLFLVVVESKVYEGVRYPGNRPLVLIKAPGAGGTLVLQRFFASSGTSNQCAHPGALFQMTGHGNHEYPDLEFDEPAVEYFCSAPLAELVIQKRYHPNDFANQARAIQQLNENDLRPTTKVVGGETVKRTTAWTRPDKDEGGMYVSSDSARMSKRTFRSWQMRLMRQVGCDHNCDLFYLQRFGNLAGVLFANAIHDSLDTLVCPALTAHLRKLLAQHKAKVVLHDIPKITDPALEKSFLLEYFQELPPAKKAEVRESCHLPPPPPPTGALAAVLAPSSPSSRSAAPSPHTPPSTPHATAASPPLPSTSPGASPPLASPSHAATTAANVVGAGADSSNPKKRTRD